MRISNILTPKSPKQVLREFCSMHKLSERELKKFLSVYRSDGRIRVLAISIISWVFGLSMIINGWIAIEKRFFWFPIKATQSMLTFINIFWAVLWFAIAVFIIIWGILILARAYDDYTNNN
jgi:hypothetical protein